MLLFFYFYKGKEKERVWASKLCMMALGYSNYVFLFQINPFYLPMIDKQKIPLVKTSRFPIITQYARAFYVKLNLKSGTYSNLGPVFSTPCLIS